MKRWMPSTERRKQHRHADNHSHRRSWQRCRTSIHATRRSGLLVQCRRKPRRSEEHTSELQSLMRISYAVFCLKKKTSPINLTLTGRSTLYYQVNRIIEPLQTTQQL